MAWERDVLQSLKRHDVDLIAYLPDSILAPLAERVEADADLEAVRVPREEAGVAALSGAWLGGRRGVLLCQSSGLANCFNVLGSHVKPAGLPFLAIVTRRGGLGDHNRAQIAAGYTLPRLLDDLGVRNHRLARAGDAGDVLDRAAETAFSMADPFVVLLEPTLTGGKP